MQFLILIFYYYSFHLFDVFINKPTELNMENNDFFKIMIQLRLVTTKTRF